MSIIVILLGLLVPAMNKAKIYAKTVNQKNQFHSIDVALELFRTVYEDYPPSDQLDDSAALAPYCGAMRLTEAVVGQDLLGFHPDSAFRADLTDGAATPNLLYDFDPTITTDDPLQPNIKSRKGPYLQVDRANAYKLQNLWGMQPGAIGNFNNRYRFVLCDEYARAANKGTEGPSRIGMPVLYYKADISAIGHNPTDAIPDIYNYTDNIDLIQLGLPWDTTKLHWLDPLSSDSGVSGDRWFYEITQNPNIAIQSGRPYRPDSYILISAGYDGEYGTEDDIYNFNN